MLIRSSNNEMLSSRYDSNNSTQFNQSMTKSGAGFSVFLDRFVKLVPPSGVGKLNESSPIEGSISAVSKPIFVTKLQRVILQDFQGVHD